MELDWEFDKGFVIFLFLVMAALATGVVISIGFLLHVGWDLYGVSL